MMSQKPSDDTRIPMVLAACGTSTVVALMMVSLRLYVRIRIVRKVGADDFAICVAMIFALVAWACVVVAVSHGSGRHAIYVDPSDLSEGLKFNFITQPLYLWGTTAVRVSISLFLLRVFPKSLTKFRRLLWAITGFLMLYATSSFLASMLQCQPINFLWGSAKTAICYSNQGVAFLRYFNVAFDFILDLLFTLLPVILLWNVKINRRTRMALLTILSLGTIVCSFAAVRAAYTPTYLATPDPLWDYSHLMISDACECNLAILAASAPTLKPFFGRLFEKISPDKGRGRGMMVRGSSNSPRTMQAVYHRESVRASSATVARMMSSEESPMGREDLRYVCEEVARDKRAHNRSVTDISGFISPRDSAGSNHTHHTQQV
ncbi:MAG: 3-isopropylmalate dehydrogenase [Chaenotheca gracillima]|nr:MAG: 3-isopropylmalate dehydrogenase [Chaenotheca gracillima]